MVILHTQELEKKAILFTRTNGLSLVRVNYKFYIKFN